MKRLIVAFICASVLCLGVASIAVADGATEACLECHDVAVSGGSSMKVDFSAASVDYDKCNNCHYLNGSRGDHWHQPTTCKTCHFGLFPTGTPYTSPQVSTSSGWFDNTGSVMSSPQSLHDIHTGGNWVDEFSLDPTLGCSRCHAPTGCDGCHESAIAHGDHAGTDVAPVPYRNTTSYASGVRVSNITCINSACHALADAATEAFVPACDTCHEETAVEHEAAHDASGVTNKGCTNCHSMDLVTEHASRGLACADCHLDAAYAAAIQAGDLSCAACHVTPVHRTSRGR